MIKRSFVVLIIISVVVKARYNEIKYDDIDDETTIKPSHQNVPENTTTNNIFDNITLDNNGTRQREINDTMASTSLNITDPISISIVAGIAIGGPIIILAIWWYVFGTKIRRLREAYIENAFPIL